MAFYETVFISRQDLGDAQVKELTEMASKIIKDQGGKILKTEQWGLKNLAYKINKSRKGHYTLIESDAPGAAIIELERILRLNEDVMRYMTIRLEEATKGPSIMMGGDKYRNDNKDDNTKEEAA
ncbi:MAG: 30S ribosomal protein S6 [Alphaproteobacteria bacterium]|nr:30S ribosomal protein S6 [Alphaproteobacteria bacterium]MCD8519882.1 30S ribosomal protein S6 [Alphaproteobacteria bacterium]MCD8525740.1 30S ribosomal protein S6 [Alphaproteobacteria bacterium]MCD8571003.1 30S ribosomal protein S6 [Alphaproteobacteria bacterium]